MHSQLGAISTSFSTLPLAQFDWIRHTGVMTEKLGQERSHVQLTVLSHQWTQANWWERHVLNLSLPPPTPCGLSTGASNVERSPNPMDERQDLGLMMNGQHALIRRDILISAAGQRCWFARTMIPSATYELEPSFFDRLHHEPLGHLIFNEPNVVRQVLHSYGINARHLEYHWLAPEWREDVATLWARLSCLEFKQKAWFYLVEIYLP